MTRWGLVATIKATTTDILNFAAYHIDLGAHRLYIYLDAPDPDAFALLKAHSKVRVFTCDAAHWRKLGHAKAPRKHQVRQSANATDAYARRAEVDWLIHMDADEFLHADAPLDRILEALPAETLCARVRPVESIAGGRRLFKGFIPAGPDRAAIVERIYPNFGRFVRGGFLSHVAGKLFLRTRLGAATVKIHNVIIDEHMNPGETELSSVALCHCHATTWEDWLAAYRYRLASGSYRPELSANRTGETGAITMHDLLTGIESDAGETGLRAFYDELCGDGAALQENLRAEGLLRVHDLEIEAKCRKHFPDFG